MKPTIQTAMTMYESAMQEDLRSGNRSRLLENQDLFIGTEHRQWDKEIAAKLAEEGRPAATYNVIQQITETVLGNLEQRPTDIKYQCLSDRDQQAVDILQSMFENDYEQGNWEYVKLAFKRDGLIHTGVMQMFVDRSRDYRGMVGLRNIHPAHIVVDPWWQTDDVRDINKMWRAEWMTAEQIKAIYRTSAPEVEAAIEFNANGRNQGSGAALDKVADRSVEYFDAEGDRYKVIEMTYMVDEPVTQAVSLDTGRIDRKVSDKIRSMPGEAGRAYKAMLSERYEIVESTRRACKVFTYCPGLSTSLVLADGDYELQLGMVPYLVFSYRQYYGYRLGLPDILKDAQQNYNKRRSQISHMIAQAGNNNWVAEDDAFKDENGVADFKNRMSKGGQVFTVTPGTNRDGKLKALERVPVPSDLIQMTQSELDIMYTLSSVVPAMQGKGETDRESGVLYEQKNSQAIVALDMISKNIKRQDQIFADMYFEAAKQLYADAPREITDRKNMRKVIVNQRIVGMDGMVQKTNSIESLERYVVDVVETRVGPGRRATELFKMSQMLPTIKDPGIYSAIEKQIIKLMDLPAEEVQQALASSEATASNAVAQQEAQLAQAQAAAQQAIQPPQPQPQATPQPPAPSGMSMPLPHPMPRL